MAEIAVHFHARVPLHRDAGWVELEIDIDDAASATERDKTFVAGIIDKFSQLAIPAIGHAPEVPGVLRGVVAGGRP